jgi:hypothetical protein
MAQLRTLTLTEGQEQALRTLRNQTKDEYVRERCAALLKVAGGKTPHWVARHGLLKPRDPDTIYGWLDIYEAEGLVGLQNHQHGGSRRGCL